MEKNYDSLICTDMYRFYVKKENRDMVHTLFCGMMGEIYRHDEEKVFAENHIGMRRDANREYQWDGTKITRIMFIDKRSIPTNRSYNRYVIATKIYNNTAVVQIIRHDEIGMKTPSLTACGVYVEKKINEFASVMDDAINGGVINTQNMDYIDELDLNISEKLRLSYYDIEGNRTIASNLHLETETETSTERGDNMFVKYKLMEGDREIFIVNMVLNAIDQRLRIAGSTLMNDVGEAYKPYAGMMYGECAMAAQWPTASVMKLNPDADKSIEKILGGNKK